MFGGFSKLYFSDGQNYFMKEEVVRRQLYTRIRFKTNLETKFVLTFLAAW